MLHKSRGLGLTQIRRQAFDTCVGARWPAVARKRCCLPPAQAHQATQNQEPLLGAQIRGTEGGCPPHFKRPPPPMMIESVLPGVIPSMVSPFSLTNGRRPSAWVESAGSRSVTAVDERKSRTMRWRNPAVLLRRMPSANSAHAFSNLPTYPRLTDNA